MNTSMEDFVTGGNGCICITSSSGSVSTHDFYCFWVNEACVVTSIQHSDNPVNVIDTYKLQGVTLSAGAIIVPNVGFYFSQITLSSGSIIAYKR